MLSEATAITLVFIAAFVITVILVKIIVLFLEKYF